MNLIFLFILNTEKPIEFLPQWMTPEESLKIEEIGRSHLVTPPPGCAVVTPAEYEPVRGVFVTWIYGTFNSVEREIVRNVVATCKAFIIASAGDTINIKNYLSNGGVPLDSVRFFIFPYNSVWIRDYGPWFIRKEDNTEGIVDFQYNRPRPLDDTIPWRIGNAFGIPVYGSPLEHPGGNFMVDGHNTGFFSSLIYQENPSYTVSQIDSLMYEYSGLEQTIPLKRILIEYTGHIDLWTKILNDTLVMVGEYAPGHPNDTVLDNRADSIANCKNREGFPYRVVRIVMPWSTSDAPPSYLNSLFVNDRILVPIYGLPEDQEALLTYQQYLPGYQVVGINCSSMSGSGGAIHCITMQVPKAQFIHILHNPLSDTYYTPEPYRVRARIITSSGLIPESTLVFYKVNSGLDFTAVPLSPVIDTPGVYVGYIPPQSPDDTIYYYLLSKNTGGIRKTSPSYVPPQIYSFRILQVAVLEKSTKSLNGFALYPNPTQGAINISVSVLGNSNIKFEIYNALGQMVESFENCYEKGYHTIKLLEKDRLNSGVYFYKMTINGEITTGKFLVIK
uniref:T9SS type A sorting domain-containing protein n=1 Tax=candidate division WOR-3 bacterium TaxID=2052148 RepID=A0A7C4XK53_UNCW3